MALLAEKLREEGISIRFSSSEDALEYLVERGFTANEVPLIDARWGEGGKLSGRATLKGGVRTIRDFALQLRLEVKYMRSCAPSLVLSDSRLSAVLAAALLRIPSFVILNQLRILFPLGREPRPPYHFESLDGEFLGLMWSLSQAILIPDLPPPYTLSERNLWGVRTTRGKVRYVGFMLQRPRISEAKVKKLVDELKLDRRKPTVFAPLSGPLRTKGPLIKEMFRASSIYGERYNFVVSAGAPQGNKEPTRMKRAWYYEWCPVRDELFSVADVIITRGGHSTLAQSILFGKPTVVIPIINHGEQWGNGTKVSELGVGILLDQRTLKPEKLEAAISTLMKDEEYVKRAEGLRQIAMTMDGVEGVLSIVKDRLAKPSN